MKSINGLHDLRTSPDGSVVTVGVFDGVHAGHRRIISAVTRKARKLGLKSIVVTFDPHPSSIVDPRNNVPGLISLKHRVRLIGQLGVDEIIVIKFTKSFSKVSPEKFVGNILSGKLRTKEICVGENFYFGRSGVAGTTALKDMARRYGFGVNIIRPLRYGGRTVSSSRIRGLIKSGDLREAEKLLGRPVSVFGTVIRGARLARELGYPTANLNPHHEVVPPGGVYAVMVRAGGRLYRGVLNIGVRPTFYAPRDREPAIEVHIFSFKAEIYGKDVEVYFVRKIRDEIKFKSAAALIEQIRADAKTAEKVLSQSALQISKSMLS